jgi:hypothetical protein
MKAKKEKIKVQKPKKTVTRKTVNPTTPPPKPKK